jgi:hypothetical protein
MTTIKRAFLASALICTALGFAPQRVSHVAAAAVEPSVDAALCADIGYDACYELIELCATDLACYETVATCVYEPACSDLAGVCAQVDGSLCYALIDGCSLLAEPLCYEYAAECYYDDDCYYVVADCYYEDECYNLSEGIAWPEYEVALLAMATSVYVDTGECIYPDDLVCPDDSSLSRT